MTHTSAIKKITFGYKVAIHALASLALFGIYLSMSQASPPAFALHVSAITHSLLSFAGKALIIAIIAALLVWEFTYLSRNFQPEK